MDRASNEIVFHNSQTEANSFSWTHGARTNYEAMAILRRVGQRYVVGACQMRHAILSATSAITGRIIKIPNI